MFRAPMIRKNGMMMNSGLMGISGAKLTGL
jgi:hypothetical protein